MASYFGGAARNPSGTIGSDRKNAGTQGKSNASNTNKMTSTAAGAYFGGKDRNPEGDIGSDARANRLSGKSTGSGGGAGTGALSAPADDAPTIQHQPFTVSPPGSVPVSGDAAENGLLDDGGIVTHRRFSAGQLVDALGLAASVATGGIGSAVAGIAGSDAFGRSLLGQAVDEETGGVPDLGYTGGNHIASSSNRRGDTRGADDTRLMDRGGATASGGAPVTGDGAVGGDDGGAEFSSVRLKDRRRPYDEVAASDLLRGLL